MNILKSAPRKLWSFLNVVNRIIPKNYKKIFIYSNLGFRDNVKAVFDYLIDNGYNNEYTIVCSLNDFKNQPKIRNVRFVGNIRGLLSFFSCQYVFYCFGKYPVKPRRGQKVFNLWHGMPLKKIGNMIKGCEKVDYNYFTHLLCTSDFFRNIMKESFNCSDENIVICGQPRTDEMLRFNNPEKLLLWLPTYRDGGGDLSILSREQLFELDSLCGKYGWNIIVKLHPLSAVSGYDSGLRHIKIIGQNQLESDYGSLYKLLGRSSCLITDYSSVFFDYLLLDRPVGFAVGDWDDYSAKRGFTLGEPQKYMPGEIISDGKSLLRFINEVFDGIDRFAVKRRELNLLFNRFHDDSNCRRAIETLGIRKEK